MNNIYDRTNSAIRNFGKSMSPLMAALQMIASGDSDGVPRKNSHFDRSTMSRKKSQKGAVHKHNPTFKSRQILPMTPAQYRHMHMGSLKGA